MADSCRGGTCDTGPPCYMSELSTRDGVTCPLKVRRPPHVQGPLDLSKTRACAIVAPCQFVCTCTQCLVWCAMTDQRQHSTPSTVCTYPNHKWWTTKHNLGDERHWPSVCHRALVTLGRQTETTNTGKPQARAPRTRMYLGTLAIEGASLPNAPSCAYAARV